MEDGLSVLGMMDDWWREGEQGALSESLLFIAHVYRLYDCHAMRSAIPPHGCEFEVRVNAVIG